MDKTYSVCLPAVWESDWCTGTTDMRNLFLQVFIPACLLLTGVINRRYPRSFLVPARFYHKLPVIFFPLAVLLFWTLFFCPVSATSGDQYSFTDNLGIPREYGEVIYRIAGTGSKQLYIVGISHRDPQSGVNGSNTARTQADVFRIGEWLNQHRKIQLLLPEGYFAGQDSTSDLPQPVSARAGKDSSGQLDAVFLQKTFADENRYVNAEMLLLENFDMRVCQVEDKPAYDAVRSSLHNLRQADSEGGKTFKERLAELHSLQEARTAKLLQKIPSLIDGAVCNGTVRDRSAIFTIGLNHIQDIVRFFQNDAISIDLPLSEPFHPEHRKTELNLLKKGYGVTIIIPRTLANDRDLLRMTNLDGIFLASTNQARQMRLN